MGTLRLSGPGGPALAETGLPLPRSHPRTRRSHPGGPLKDKAGKIDPKDQKRQTRKNLRKLDRLIRFAETTRYMEDEQVRKEVLLVLRLVKREWSDTLTD